MRGTPSILATQTDCYEQKIKLPRRRGRVAPPQIKPPKRIVTKCFHFNRDPAHQRQNLDKKWVVHKMFILSVRN